MDTFFNILKKVLTGAVFVAFGLVFTYIPQPFNHSEVRTAEAFDPDPDVPSITALTAETATIVVNTTAQNVKEYGLDGIGWVLAKAVISSMIASTVDWINSGFKGSPAFVQDLDRFLLGVADEVAGAYLQELGGEFSFLCSPYSLNIRIALALEYQQARERRPYEGCRITEAFENFEEFVSGNFIEGGWNSWFEITAHPEIYTEYGQYLAARETLNQRISEAESREAVTLNFGDGFLSSKVCEQVDGPEGPEEQCRISTPGQTISKALSKTLGLPQDSLVSADEIDEVIGALVGQIAVKAITGAAGLLGLSANTGYTYDSFDAGSYVNQLRSNSSSAGASDIEFIDQSISDTLQLQADYRALAQDYRTKLQQKLARPLSAEPTDEELGARQTTQISYEQTVEVINKIEQDLPKIRSFRERLAEIKLEFEDPNTSAQRKEELSQLVRDITVQFANERFYTKANYDGSKRLWENALNETWT